MNITIKSFAEKLKMVSASLSDTALFHLRAIKDFYSENSAFFHMLYVTMLSRQKYKFKFKLKPKNFYQVSGKMLNFPPNFWIRRFFMR